MERFNKLAEKMVNLAEQNNCDGECDTESPYVKCRECSARSLINELAPILREELLPSPPNESE